MRLPIRNETKKPLKLYVEIECFEFDIPAGGEAIIEVVDNEYSHSISVGDGYVVFFNEGEGEAVVSIKEPEQKAD